MVPYQLLWTIVLVFRRIISCFHFQLLKISSIYVSASASLTIVDFCFPVLEKRCFHHVFRIPCYKDLLDSFLLQRSVLLHPVSPFLPFGNNFLLEFPLAVYQIVVLLFPTNLFYHAAAGPLLCWGAKMVRSRAIWVSSLITAFSWPDFLAYYQQDVSLFIPLLSGFSLSMTCKLFLFTWFLVLSMN